MNDMQPKPQHFRPRNLALSLFLPLCATLSACAPTIRLDTPAPIVIDVNMKVDVVQSQAPGTTPLDAGAALKQKSPRQKQRERMAEVQSLKNDRTLGEANTGYLAMVNKPAKADYVAYAERIMNEENADRKAIFEEEAAKDKTQTEAEIATAYAKRWYQGAFPGEMIQDATGKWVQR